MSVLEIIAVLISVLGVTLTIKRHIACWVVNFIACLLYAYLFFEYQLYGETVLQTLFMGMAIYGFYQWKTTQQDTQAIVIQTLSQNKMLQQLILSMGLGLIFGLSLMQWTQASVPLLDAQLAALSLLATYWTSRKYLATWLLWIVVDLLYVGMFIYKALFLTAALYVGFVVLAYLGWREWSKIRQQQHVQVLP
ncbi:MAG: nicotinamide riboside transporter PnuC [Acinetobacter towneri]|jgi:nicotinamide mononucleotide transporter|uniref:nicotinamide riboside transporter PnuC n=1 Tax=Acinetobacter TaxID=469 RepID=UPI00109CBF0C|nr:MULTISPECIES: nicotinamide riboside transporter PnuC [Acinetobacter]MBF4521488.1 nicotinamide mononucleotide transporter [Acinetobacter towneri]MDM1755776.1 nicotinamide mononucleotide transporter [Acinetobacter towneri]MDV2485785.1 nicotinamide riboside transporter PnuC [Acinetobacter towneri]MEB6563865.1 nicotinamide riboside transporter PnuC [Acinetobacter towneri]WOE28033.1 nicotinamide riboside transporter PnuC [Acinetobacter towneri]